MLNRVMLGVVLAALATLASSQSRRATEVELRWSVDGGSVEAALRADLDGLLVGQGGVTDVQARLRSLEGLRA
ncbi:MAG: hypothetical protein VYE73_18760, partial [Acidobacteriota bacterium]|nr:hypothetical protein [Acidobacteriota bacterium]